MSSTTQSTDLCTNAEHAAHERHPAQNCAQCLADRGEPVPLAAVSADGWTPSKLAVRKFVGNRPGSAKDPTQTKTLRSNYAGEAYNRFRQLKGAIITAVVENDVFGIGEIGTNSELVEDFQPNSAQERKIAQNFEAPPPRAFDFPDDSKKVEEFREWLDGQVADGILETTENPSIRHTSRTSEWQNTYLRQAYSKGANHAEYAAKEAGLEVSEQATAAALFNAPRHADAVGLVYSRAYQELDGITNAMSQSISRELANGLSQGHNPVKIARSLNSEVADIGTKRARLMARTETIRGFNEAALNRYADMGIQEVTAAVEFRTAQDDRVCDECASLDGNVYELDEAKGIIPRHPRCRCTWLPNAHLRN